MVISKDTALPEISELETEECNLGTPYLLAGAYHLGKHCEVENNEFMLCRKETRDPRQCYKEGQIVTACTLDFFRAVKKNCAEELTDYAHCLEKSSYDYKLRLCRNTQAELDTCMKDKLGMVRPHIGYFTEARLHESTRPKPEPQAPLYFPGAIRDLPDPDIPRGYTGRHGARQAFGV